MALLLLWSSLGLACGCGRDTIEGPTDPSVEESWKGVEPAGPPAKPPQRIESLRITPDKFSLPIGAHRAFQVLGRLPQGQEIDLTKDVTLGVEDPTLVEVSEDRVLVAKSAGTTTLLATYGTFESRAEVVVESRQPEYLEISPRKGELRRGESLQFRATGIYPEGQRRDLTEDVLWSTSQAEVALASNAATTEGLVQGTGAGQTEVMATLGGLQDAATLRVIVAADLLGIVADPPALTLLQGDVQPIQVWGIYTDGTRLPLRQRTTLSVADTSILAPQPDGTFKASQPGTTNVTFTYDAFRTTAHIEVLADDLETILLYPPSLDLVPGATAQIQATGVLRGGRTLDVTRALAWSSSDGVVASVLQGRVRANRGGATRVEASWQDRVKATAQVQVTSSPLRRLAIEPPEQTLAPGLGRQLVAMTYHDDGSRADVSASATWTHSNPAVATLSEDGLIKGRQGGVTVVLASLGQGQSARATIDVTGAALSRLEISPGAVTLGPGQQAAFGVWAVYEDGSRLDATGSAAWTTDDPGVAVVQNTEPAGLVTARGLGGTEITARFLDQAVSAQVLVTQERLRTIVIDPPTLTMPRGTSFPLEARGDYGRGEGQERRITDQVQWQSSDPTRLFVQNSPGFHGRLRALAPGKVTVTAWLDGVSAAIEVEVKDLKLAQIEVTPNRATIQAGDLGQYNATGVFEDGTSVYITQEALWETQDLKIAQALNAPGASGEVLAREAGTTDVLATYLGVVGRAEITVKARTLAELVLWPDTQTLPVGEQAQMSARAVFVGGSSRNVTGLATWSVNDGTVAQIDDRGVVRALKVGETTITVSYAGQEATAQLRVSEVSLDRIEISPANLEINAGGLVKFWATAIYSDGSLKDVSELSQWSSDVPKVMSVTQSSTFALVPGIGQAHAPGSTTIRAQYDGLVGSTTASVTEAKVLEVKVTPLDITVAPGTEMRFFAQAIFDDGTSRDVTFVSTWGTVEGTILDVSQAWRDRGKVKARKEGVGDVVVKYQNVTGKARVTVTSSTLAKVQVVPFLTQVNQGDQIRFFATAIYDDGTTQQITDKALWTVSDRTLADISNAMWQEGLVTTKAPGKVTVYATYQGVLGKAELDITGLQIQSIQVTPFLQTIPTGYHLRMQATAIYGDGSVRDITGLAAWTSTAPKVADVFASFWVRGVAQGLAPGSATIQATYQGVSGGATLDVTSATLQSIALTPETQGIRTGESAEFEAEGTFSDGTTWEVTHYVTWSSSDTAIADVSNAWLTRGEATGFAPGTAQIRATQGSVQGQATLTVSP